MVALKRDHPKELQKLKAATGVQPWMIKTHFYKCTEIIRWSWSLTAGITCRHATECRVQAWVTAASEQQGQLSPHPAAAHLHVCSAHKPPATSSMSVPGESFSSATGSSEAPIQHCKNWHGAAYRWRSCALLTPFHPLCLSLASSFGKDLSPGI